MMRSLGILESLLIPGLANSKFCQPGSLLYKHFYPVGQEQNREINQDILERHRGKSAIEGGGFLSSKGPRVLQRPFSRCRSMPSTSLGFAIKETMRIYPQAAQEGWSIPETKIALFVGILRQKIPGRRRRQTVARD
jgi:hypothetical protein